MENTSNDKSKISLLEEFIRAIAMPLLGDAFKSEGKSDALKEQPVKKVQEKINNDNLAPETNVFIRVYMKPKRKGLIRRIIAYLW